MLQVRKSEERGLAEHGWLSSRHTFSFAGYWDPQHMGFGPLRVINEDRVQGGQGFGTHSHQDMEIISYVLDGALEHKDSLGTGSVLRYGDVQRMSAGTGVRHSEFNHDAAETVHFLQIWVMPEKQGVKPSYEEKHFDEASKRGQLRLIVSPDGRDGSLRMNQDAYLYASILDSGDKLTHTLASGRLGYVHVARGSLTVNGTRLNTGDALQIENESSITLEAAEAAELLVFDLPR
ncbi:pirin family protein [Dyella subtropica]|uniref:pirin family protein n=1 Tax=Dyella subtropica TaxID=2992127 RepID=UPI0022599CF8|nr:pirin family protein [Dyella subtropica]